MLCPFCFFPILQMGTGEITCSVCRAGLNISIEVFRQPNEEWLLEPRRNMREGATVTCHVCQGTIIIGKEKEHRCKPENKTPSIVDCGHGHFNKGNCPTCRGQITGGKS